MGAAPVLYSLYAVLATLVSIRAGAPMKWRIWTPFLTMAALPVLGYFALKFGEAGIDVLKCAFCGCLVDVDLRDYFRSLRPLVISLIPGQEKQLDKLKEMRRQLQKEVSDTIDEFGPKLYEDFNDVRVPFPYLSRPFTD